MIKRILIKVSGELLGGSSSSGIDQTALFNMAKCLKEAYDTNTQFGIVIGAGNIIRGLSAQFLNRTKADNTGMLGTAINAIALQDTLETHFNVNCKVLGAFCIDGMFEKSSYQLLEQSFAENQIVIFAGGIGAPYFSTDTAGVLKALEINADLMIKATKVDGIYDKDPTIHSNAKKYDSISYQEVLAQKLNVMDFTAISLAMENQLPIYVTTLSSDNIISIIQGKKTGTLVTCE